MRYRGTALFKIAAQREDILVRYSFTLLLHVVKEKFKLFPKYLLDVCSYGVAFVKYKTPVVLTRAL